MTGLHRSKFALRCFSVLGVLLPPHPSSLVHSPPHRKANATFVILARNSDLDGAVRSVRSIEDRFNAKLFPPGEGYPYVFLSEVEFTDEFKKRITVLTSSPVTFGLIPQDHWFQPSWIDEDLARSGREQLIQEGIIYGESVSYRFNSGFFFRHPLLQEYRWYWRIEPDVHFHCDIDFDPFLYLENNNKTYGFTIALYEYESTVKSLWGAVQEFTTLHPEYVAKDNAMHFLSSDAGKSYNMCHFWSNFEIADLDFWRGAAYTAFFEHLDRKGGFYYERWGDAPVHSLAAALFLNKSQIHFFDEIGYEHWPYVHCPQPDEVWKKGKCSCGRSGGESFDYTDYSCLSTWEQGFK
ncbi:glycosyl transferase [Gymnopus androsaceus JB14]|uniref:Glycosyl transferase n=1 Tax=Gymnopus androsaceus JB14 TaxID=1447944 RepID=A0A6A4I0G6_9AGAR|nr:glycosyl transferase [Gymnopus androsaceus JB14]